MSIGPLFGTLNGTVSATIAQNMPKGVTKIVEPFGDGGTFALELKKKRPKEHIVNIVDEKLFNAFDFIKNAPRGDLKALKRFDWVSSGETFDAVSSISADSGPEMFYRWFYLKKFGMVMDPDAPPVYDVLSFGDDIKTKLPGISIMRVGLKGVTLTNEDPMSMFSVAGGNAFLILLPSGADLAQEVRAKLGGVGGSFFFAAKVKDAAAIAADISTFGQYNVSALSAA
jgi:hypothetical protein